MDVSPCNPLFDLRLDAQVLSKTLNGSTKDKRKILERKILKAGNFIPAFFSSIIPNSSLVPSSFSLAKDIDDLLRE
jgi:hypothetical protein